MDASVAHRGNVPASRVQLRGLKCEDPASSASEVGGINDAQRGPMALKNNGAAAALRLPGVRTKGDVVASRYRVEAILGKGTSGFVVAARHVQLRHPVRLKILTSATRAQQKIQRKFLAAAHQAASLEGRHVARVIDTGITDDDDAFIATEALDGTSLADELKVRGKVTVEEAVRWTAEACAAVGEAHASGFLHGDLKPQNVFLVGGGVRTVKVADFGMNAMVDDGSPAFFTSPAYLAPEQIRDPEHADARADVWALGVILHEAIAGSLPFAASTVSAMLVAVAFHEAAPLADVPPALAALVKRCLAKEPAERPANANVLGRELVAALVAPAFQEPSSEPPRAMTVDADLPSALKTAPYPLMMHSEIVKAVASPAPPVNAAAPNAIAFPPPPRLPSLDDVPALSLSRGPDAVERRRRGAILTACAAGVVALIGFALPTNDDPRAARDSERPSMLPMGESTSVGHDPGEAPFFVPASFQLPETPSLVREDEVLGDVDEPASLPVPPLPSSTPMPPSQLDAAFDPVGRSFVRQLPGASKHPALPVREDPYTRGFTHPTRLVDPRK